MKLEPTFLPRRRSVLSSAILGAAAGVAPAWVSGQGSQREWSLAQVVDTSQSQQDVSKDFVVGVRAAISEINARGGVRGRKVSHSILETDGSSASTRSALSVARSNASTMALMGTVGNDASVVVSSELASSVGTAASASLGQCAPWLLTSIQDHASTLSLFATRSEQIVFAVNALNVIGVRDVAVVYADANQARELQTEVASVTTTLGLAMRSYTRADVRSDWKAVSRLVEQDKSPMILFLGGTPELAGLLQALGNQSRQRFVVGLADVNLAVLQQLGAPKGLAVVATQVVPVVSSSMGVVREYRQALGRFFDEPPSSQSLAGYVSARATLEVISSVNGSPSRDAVFETLTRKTSVEFEGVAFSRVGAARRKAFVTQSMLSADGRWI